ncbi:hypothetical protein EOM09_02670 [bacterium]|nr:hypothetical protein [bacterium]
MYEKKVIRIEILFIYIVLAQNILFAISPTSQINSIGQSEFVGERIFPVSSDITFDVYDFNFITDYPTKMTFDIEGGYGTRDNIQDPITGLESWCDNYSSSENNTYFQKDYRYYGIIYSGWEMKFSQLLPISKKLPGNLTTWISTSGHYEQAIDLVQNYLNTNPYEKVTIFNQLINDANEKFVGVPDLSGDHFSENFSLNLGFYYNQTIFNDISLNYYMYNYYSPYWYFNNTSDDDSNFSYYKFMQTLSFSKTLYNINYNDLFTGANHRLLGITLYNSTTYRYISGELIPRYMVDYYNLTHDINNSLELYIYGPQIISGDTYPYLKLFYYSDFRWGKLNNCTFDEYNNGHFSHYLAAFFDFRVIGIIHFQYRIYYYLQSSTYNKYAYFYVQL